MPTGRQIRKFQQAVYDYYNRHKRLLPWRQTNDPYKIIVSEVMLQQTQVPRVLEKYPEFLKVFPDVTALAAAPLHSVMAVWQGMGYNRRALSLKKMAAVIVSEHNGRIPSDADELRRLPGVGYATACAVCAFAFNKPVIFIETNIRSVFIHHFFNGKKKVKDSDILPLLQQALDVKNPRAWYSALMDYGTVLKKQHANPGKKSAHYHKQTPFKGSDRQLRGLVLKRLVEERKIKETVLYNNLGFDKERVRNIVSSLRKERLIRKEGRYVML